jgi:hypothetical protein
VEAEGLEADKVAHPLVFMGCGPFCFIRDAFSEGIVGGEAEGRV